MTVISTPSTFFVKNLGCKVNQFDANALDAGFLSAGFKLSANSSSADICVINSCSVTETAQKETRYLARRFKRENSNAMVVVTGCYAQIDSASLVELDDVDFVVPNIAKTELVDLVAKRIALPENNSSKMPTGLTTVSKNRQEHFKSSLTLFETPLRESARAVLKVQDGCDSFCTYCLIPYARGASRSVELSKVVAAAEDLARQGYLEIVLTGIHVGDYGEDLNPSESFSTLIENLMAATPSNLRFRISSLEPMELSPLLLEALAKFKNRICDHFHLPLQSGSDAILKKMRRAYQTEEYAEKVQKLRNIFPGAAIGADLIPGFPSESESDFNATYQFVEKLDLAYLHVFPYSARPNTAALRIPGKVAPELIKQRSQKLGELSSKLKSKYQKQQIGRVLDVIWRKKANGIAGTASNYSNIIPLIQTGLIAGAHSKVLVKGLGSDGELRGKVL